MRSKEEGRQLCGGCHVIAVPTLDGDDRVPAGWTDPACCQPARTPRRHRLWPCRDTCRSAATATFEPSGGPARPGTGSLAERRRLPRRGRVCAGRSGPARIRCRAAWKMRRRSHPVGWPPGVPVFRWWFRSYRRRRARCRAPDRTAAARCRHPAIGGGVLRVRRSRRDHRCAARFARLERRRARFARWRLSPGLGAVRRCR